jgi:hypothetical protein
MPIVNDGKGINIRVERFKTVWQRLMKKVVLKGIKRFTFQDLKAPHEIISTTGNGTNQSFSLLNKRWDLVRFRILQGRAASRVPALYLVE